MKYRKIAAVVLAALTCLIALRGKARASGGGEDYEARAADRADAVIERARTARAAEDYETRAADQADAAIERARAATRENAIARGRAQDSDAPAGFGAGLSLTDSLDPDSVGITAELGLGGRRKRRGLGCALETTVSREKYAHLMLKFYVMNLVRTSGFSIPVYVGVGAFVGRGKGRSEDGTGGNEAINSNIVFNPGDRGPNGRTGPEILRYNGPTRVGARAPLGVAIEFANLPAHVFAEVALQANKDDQKIEPHTALGFRLFF